MADVEVRLHITPAELADFFDSIQERYGVFFVGMTRQTGELKDRDRIRDFLMDQSPTRSAYVFPTDPADMIRDNPPAARKLQPSYFDGKLNSFCRSSMTTALI